MAKKKVKRKKKSSHRAIRVVPEKKQLSMPPVPVKPEQLRGNYCNSAIITHSQREFVFDFLFTIGENAVLASRIITNPQHVKQIHQVLGTNIADYESKFGEIVLK